MNLEPLHNMSVRDMMTRVSDFGRQKYFGWHAFDAQDIGTGPGDLTIAAARTGHGKSALLVNVMATWLEKYPEENFIYYSFEIPPEGMFLRFVSIFTRMAGAKGVDLSSDQSILTKRTGSGWSGC